MAAGQHRQGLEKESDQGRVDVPLRPGGIRVGMISYRSCGIEEMLEIAGSAALDASEIGNQQNNAGHQNRANTDAEEDI